MRFAFMILAHQHPLLLQRLIDRLSCMEASFVVHIDAKHDVEPFKRLVADRPAVSFVPDAQRVSVNYMGFSFVRATLATLEQAYAGGADRFVLLSGVDYPVRPLGQILAELGRDREWLAVDRRCHRDGIDWFDSVAFDRFFGDRAWLGERTGHPGLVALVRRISARLPRRHAPLPIYYGPAWWCLTREAVTELRASFQSDPARLDWFRWTRLPDEMLFQSFLKQSSRAKHIAMDATVEGTEPFFPGRAATHFVDFDRPGFSSPADLELAHLERIVASGALFARKISPTRSLPLLDELDRRYHGIE